MFNFRIAFLWLYMNFSFNGLQGKQIDFVPVEGLPSDRFVIDYRLEHISTLTASHCAVECQQLDACIMFQYTALTKSCQLYYDEITGDSNSIHYAYGPQVYKAYCSPAKDYLYYRTHDVCLHRHRDRKNFTAARDACFQEGGTLFEPQTVPQMYFYQQYSKNTGEKAFIYYVSQRFWVGGYGDSVAGGWFWFTGDEILNGSSLWLPTKPSGGFDNPCLEVKIGAANLYGLNDRNCSYTREFFCQTEF